MLWCIFPLQFPSVLGPNSFGFRWFYHTKICSLPKVRVHREGLTFLQTPKRQGAFMHRAASLPFSEAKVLLKCGNCLHATKYLFLMPKVRFWNQRFSKDHMIPQTAGPVSSPSVSKKHMHGLHIFWLLALVVYRASRHGSWNISCNYYSTMVLPASSLKEISQ